MRLGEVTAIIPCDIPIDTVGRHVLGEEGLAKIVAVEAVLPSDPQDFRPGGIVDLPGICRQRVIGARRQVGILHDAEGGFLQARRTVAKHAVITPGPRAPVAFFGPPLLCPFRSCTFNKTGEGFGGCLGFPYHVRLPGMLTLDLPRSR
jgi:hypothetical protein